MAKPDRRSPEAIAYRKLYKTARWRAIREAQLAKQPLCERCLKRKLITPATVCHHTDKDSKKNPATFYRGPFESSCAPCHDGEAQSEEARGFSTAIDEDGWPSDPRHPANR